MIDSRISREEWRSQIAQAQEEFAQQQQQQQQRKDGKQSSKEPSTMEPTGSMLMLGSKFTGDYEQMSRRVQNGIYVQKFKSSHDEKIPQHLLPYRDQMLPKEFRVNAGKEGAMSAGPKSPQGGDQRDSDHSRAPTPRQQPHTASATPRNAAATPSQTASKPVQNIPHIGQMSFMGGLGLQDTTDYAAMCRRRPEKGLPGKLINFLDLGVLDTPAMQDRLAVMPTNRTQRETARASLSDEISNLPKTPRDDLRPQTSGGLTQRAREHEVESSRSHAAAEASAARSNTRPHTSQVGGRLGGGVVRIRGRETPRGRESPRDRAVATPRVGAGGEERWGVTPGERGGSVTSREAKRPWTSGERFEPKVRVPDSKKNNLFGGMALSADEPRTSCTQLQVLGFATDRKTHAEKEVLKAEWENYISKERVGTLKDAEALRMRNKRVDDSASHAIQPLDSFLGGGGAALKDTMIHVPSERTPRASAQTPRGSVGEGERRGMGAEKEGEWQKQSSKTEAQAAVAQISRLLWGGKGNAQAHHVTHKPQARGPLSARGVWERGGEWGNVGKATVPTAPKTARPDLASKRPQVSPYPPPGASRHYSHGVAHGMSSSSNNPSGGAAAIRARASSPSGRGLQVVHLAKTTLGFALSSAAGAGATRKPLGGQNSLAAHRAGSARY